MSETDFQKIGYETQFGKGFGRVPKGVCASDGDLRNQQDVSGRGTICVDESNPPFLAFRLLEFA